MADALCGPSNALQNFQKHSSVDRTLQQDRLTNRHSPTQGFRSSPGPNAGVLDPEFDAFQAGHAGPPQPNLHFPPPTLAPQFPQSLQGPDWASDFQRLNITSKQPPLIQQQHTPQSSNTATSWHQDFMRQQPPVTQAPLSQNNMFGGLSGQGMTWSGPTLQQRPMFGAANGASLSETTQRQQRAFEGVPEFDEAAFERAFEQAQMDAIAHETSQLETERTQNIRPAETDPVLLRIRESRPSIYTTLKFRSAVELNQSYEDCIPWLEDLENMESSGRMTEDASQARWCVDALEKILNHDPQVTRRVEHLITAINQRLMSTYPLLSSRVPINQDNIWEELEAAGYTRTPVSERVEQQQEQKKEEQPLRNDDDEMAETAGKLLERVADNTSEKFQNSQFLELMRRLRDREVRVEGDKMVEVSSAQPSSTSTPLPSTTAAAASSISSTKFPPIPEVDQNILNHAATDFAMPVDSEQELGTNSATTTSTHHITGKNVRIPVHEQDLDLGRSGVIGRDPEPGMQ